MPSSPGRNHHSQRRLNLPGTSKGDVFAASAYLELLMQAARARICRSRLAREPSRDSRSCLPAIIIRCGEADCPPHPPTHRRGRVRAGHDRSGQLSQYQPCITELV